MKNFHSDSFKNESSEAINKRGGCLWLIQVCLPVSEEP